MYLSIQHKYELQDFICQAPNQLIEGAAFLNELLKVLRSYAPGVREQKLDMQNQTEVKTNYLLNGSLYGYSVIRESIRLLRFRVVAVL